MKERKYLTENQKEYIIKNYPFMQTAEIAEKLGVTLKQVKGYAWNKKIKKDKNFITVRSDNKFNYEEADFIYENFANTTNDILAEKLGCETKDIVAFARIHKLTKSSNIYKDFRGMPIEAKKFIIENYQTMRTEEIAKITGQSPDRVRSYAYLHGIKKDTNKIISMCDNGEKGLTTSQKEYIIANYENQSNEDIAKKINCKIEQIHSYASNRKLKKNILFCKSKPHYFEQCFEFHKSNNFELNKYLGSEIEPKIAEEDLYKSKYGKWSYNQNYFEKIDNEWKAYWLGFLYADGYICHNCKSGKAKNSVSLALAAKDEFHLEKFKNSIQTNSPIRQYESHLNGKVYYNSKINVCSEKMCEDLIALGCTPNKSLTLIFPKENQVDKKYLRHFVRGYFDGDGCISINMINRNASFNLIGTKDFLESVENLLRTETGIPKVNVIPSNNSKAYVLQYGNIRSIELIYKYLYRNSNIFLDRKIQKFNKVFSLA